MNGKKLILSSVIAGMLLSGIFVILIAQEDKEAARRQLSQIRREIDQLQRQLKQSQNTLQASLAGLENLDQQTTLQRKAVEILQKEIVQNKRAIAGLNVEIDTVQSRIDLLQTLFRKQMVFTYKYQTGKELEWLLGSQSFNQALLRYRYFQTVSKSVHHTYNRLLENQRQLQTLQRRRVGELQRQQQLLGEKTAEQQEFQQKIAQRKALINKISRNKTLLEAALREKIESSRKLEGIIGSLEMNRSKRGIDPDIDRQWDKITGNFASQKGKLNWPVRGKVFRQFGNVRNPELKTVLINNGIDIRAEKGTNVHSVFPGVVSTVTYISGFGNTIIIDHNKGYYTVFAHLDEVFVSKFQFAEAGTVIGTVGDSGSLEGAMLHFEIYGENKPLDPVSWLGER